jgi:hypothetical protein
VNPEKSVRFHKNGIKTGKNSEKPVETRLFPLTKLPKRRKVNGGRFFQIPAWIQGFRAVKA